MLNGRLNMVTGIFLVAVLFAIGVVIVSNSLKPLTAPNLAVDDAIEQLGNTGLQSGENSLVIPPQNAPHSAYSRFNQITGSWRTSNAVAVPHRDNMPAAEADLTDTRIRNYGPELTPVASAPLADGGFAELRARNYAPETAVELNVPLADGGFAELRDRGYAPEVEYELPDGGFAELRARNYAPELQ